MLSVEELVKSYGARSAERGRVLAVDGVGFEVRERELVTLLGPSGCGKTTTLRSIAGLERPDGGTITVADRVLFDGRRGLSVPANRRGLGMVFQSYAIWPHLSVFRNVSFPLEVAPRGRRPGRAEVRRRVLRVLETVELAALAERPAVTLSGGQQQRLALARALVTEPPLVLLDEPLSNLDATLRESMRFELKRLQRELGVTAVYVTHDQAEALALSSRIVVMREGRIVQVGTPLEIYTRPAEPFVAEFVGVSNLFEGKVAEQLDGRSCVHTGQGPVWTVTRDGIGTGDAVLVLIRPESVDLVAGPATVTAPNAWRGRVVTRAFLGDSVDYVVEVAGRTLRVRARPSVSLEPGADVLVTVSLQDVVLIRTG